MIAAQSLISDLDNAVKRGSLDQRVATMKRIADLFLGGAERFNEDQVALFDTVLLHLVKWVESRALAELSRRFAPVRNAPIGVVGHLARHDDIAVAGPVLAQSERLSTTDLIEIAGSKGEAHLMAISDRPQLVEAVTDVLLQRGSNGVYCKLAQNSGAAFSNAGFQSLISRAKNNETLAANVGQRRDVPRHMLNELLATATQAVRIKLLATAPRERHGEIKEMLSAIASEVGQEIGAGTCDGKKAQEVVGALHQKNKLTQAQLMEFAKHRDFGKLVAALSLLTSVRSELIDSLMAASSHTGLLVACKAADLYWATVETISRHRHHSLGTLELEQAKRDYDELNKWAAVRLLGYWQTSAALPSA